MKVATSKTVRNLLDICSPTSVSENHGWLFAMKRGSSVGTRALS